MDSVWHKMMLQVTVVVAFKIVSGLSESGFDIPPFDFVPGAGTNTGQALVMVFSSPEIILFGVQYKEEGLVHAQLRIVADDLDHGLLDSSEFRRRNNTSPSIEVAPLSLLC